jgi:hypothetical protein
MRITYPTGISSRVVCEYLARQLYTPLPPIQPLARQKYWKISLRVVEPKIPALCDFKASKDYKKARQVKDPSELFL